MATVEFTMTTAGPGVSSSFKSRARIQVTYTAGNGKITVQSIKGKRTDGNYGNYSNNSSNYLNLTINGVTKKVNCKLIDFRGSSYQAWTNFTDQTWTGLNGSYKLSVYIHCTSSFVSGSTFSGNINAGYSSYTLTYDANGGSVSPTSATRASNATLGTLPTPSRSGYSFAGWFTAASGGTQVSSSTIMGNGNRTIYAHWNLNYYTLYFNANGGSVSPTSRSVGYGQAYGTLPTPSWTGRTFQGWYTAASGGSQVSSGTTMGAGNATIYAHWTINSYKQVINVRYQQANGSYGSYSAVVNSNYNYGSTCSWSRAADSVYNAASISYTVTGANTKYVDVTRKTYSLTLKPDSGTYNGSTSNYTTSGYAESSISLSTPAKSNCQFFGFVTTSGNGTYDNIYAFDDPASYNQIEVSVYDNNSSGQVSITRETRSTDNPLPNTYQLKITTAGAGTTPGYGGFHRITSAISGKKFYHTFLAKVPVGYTLNIANNAIGEGGTLIWVTNNKGTGNWEVYEYEVTCGTTGEFSTFGFIYLTGGSLPVTWYLGTSNISRQDKSGITYNFQTSNTTLNANYIPNYYCVQFDGNGGSGSMDILNCYYGATRTLPNNQFTRDTYKFVGWNTKADGSGASYSNQQQISNLTSTNRAFITLYAQWELDTLSVSFDANGGTGAPDPISYSYDASGATSIVIPSIRPTYNHKVFRGWAALSTSTEVLYKPNDNYSCSNAESITLYAVWSPQMKAYTKLPEGYKNGYVWTKKNGKWYQGISVLENVGNRWADFKDGSILLRGYTLLTKIKAKFGTLTDKTIIYTLGNNLPENTETLDVSNDQDGSLIAYAENNIIYITSPNPHTRIIYANPISDHLFEGDGQNLDYIYPNTILNTSKVERWDSAFLSNGDLSSDNKYFMGIDTSAATSFQQIFAGYTGTKPIELSHLDSTNVTDYLGMFASIGNIHEYDITSLNLKGSLTAMFQGTQVDYIKTPANVLTENLLKDEYGVIHNADAFYNILYNYTDGYLPVGGTDLPRYSKIVQTYEQYLLLFFDADDYINFVYNGGKLTEEQTQLVIRHYFPVDYETPQELYSTLPTNMYPLFYGLGDGKLPQNTNWAYSGLEGLSSLPIPTRQGYDFVDWREGPLLGELFASEAEIKLKTNGNSTVENTSTYSKITWAADTSGAEITETITFEIKPSPFALGGFFHFYFYNNTDLYFQPENTYYYLEGNGVSQKINTDFNSGKTESIVPLSSGTYHLTITYTNNAPSTEDSCYLRIDYPSYDNVITEIPAGTLGKVYLYANWRKNSSGRVNDLISKSQKGLYFPNSNDEPVTEDTDTKINYLHTKSTFGLYFSSTYNIEDYPSDGTQNEKIDSLENTYESLVYIE